MLFQKLHNDQSKLKMGILGFAGSGKTTTAVNIAAGLTLYQMKKGISENNKIFFLDTETASAYIEPLLTKNGLEPFVLKTRAFADLIEAIKEAEKEAAVMVIDSITHFWKELIEAYLAKKIASGKRNRFLTFDDWGPIKREWEKFTNLLVNTDLHIIVCGRAGYEYDYADNDGKRELEKTGIRMKAEGETGYETSLLVYMQRCQSLEGDKPEQWREAHVWKDRSREIDGKIFKNPSFKDFLPHIQALNLSSKHVGYDESRNSKDMFTDETKSINFANHQKEVMLEEIKNNLDRIFTASKEDKIAKNNLLQQIFGTDSWTGIESKNLQMIKDGHAAVNQRLNQIADAMAEAI